MCLAILTFRRMLLHLRSAGGRHRILGGRFDTSRTVCQNLNSGENASEEMRAAVNARAAVVTGWPTPLIGVVPYPHCFISPTWMTWKEDVWKRS